MSGMYKLIIFLCLEALDSFNTLGEKWPFWKIKGVFPIISVWLPTEDSICS